MSGTFSRRVAGDIVFLVRCLSAVEIDKTDRRTRETALNISPLVVSFLIKKRVSPSVYLRVRLLRPKQRSNLPTTTNWAVFDTAPFSKKEERPMPFYLTRFSYTPETWAKLIKNPEDRRIAAQQYIESVGGKLHGFWYAFGKEKGDILPKTRLSETMHPNNRP